MNIEELFLRRFETIKLQKFHKELDNIIAVYPSYGEFKIPHAIGHRYGELSDGTRVIYRIPLYFHHTDLPESLACYALYYYSRRATSLWITDEIPTPIDEDTPWPQPPDYKKIFRNILQQYGVTLEAAVRYWPEVENHYKIREHPLIPDEERYRFNRPLVIN